jgi:hypothetical protein
VSSLFSNFNNASQGGKSSTAQQKNTAPVMNVERMCKTQLLAARPAATLAKSIDYAVLVTDELYSLCAPKSGIDNELLRI